MTTKTAYPIQPIVAPDFGRPAELYTNAPVDSPGFASEAPWPLNEGQRLSTNTYLNALFPHVWEHFADIGDLGVTCVATGPYQIEIVAVSADESETVLVSAKCLGDGKDPCAVWSGLPNKREGRLYLRIEALGDLTIDAISWATDVPPRHDPSLSVGLCTFNREPELAETVSALSYQRSRTPEIRAIYVVNQGPSFSSENLLAEVRKQGVHLIEQPNLGGCGGFTRSMFEAISADEQTTHHLLMDDDIVLDPRLLDKVLHFLRYADQSLGLGGQMLEIESPTTLYEAGGRLHPVLFVTPVGQNTKVADPSALQLFSTTPEIDYNAWWFCVIPTAAIQEVGLPPPLFIRGDDIEYGCRLMASGIKTIPLPGCPVWHESFSRKDSDWLLYYVFRNRILLALLHPGAPARRDPVFLIGFLIALIFANRYRAAEVALKGINDVVSNPENLFEKDSQQLHSEVMDFTNNRKSSKVVSIDEIGACEIGIDRPLDTSIFGMAKLCLTSLTNVHLSVIKRDGRTLIFDQMPQATAVNGKNFAIVRNASEREYASYPSNALKVWVLLAKTIWTCGRYTLQRPKKIERVRQAFESLRHPDHWKKAFNAPRD